MEIGDIDDLALQKIEYLCHRSALVADYELHAVYAVSASSCGGACGGT